MHALTISRFRLVTLVGILLQTNKTQSFSAQGHNTQAQADNRGRDTQVLAGGGSARERAFTNPKRPRRGAITRIAIPTER
uniref:Putative secreted protein n=1 Tax=Anopheles darlingi TaxID=43151 RepID=A0A2M4DLE2_ANODA